MKRLLSSKEVKSLQISNGFELVESYNKENCVTAKTKIIIVGTITPPKASVYFYTSPYNCIYGYIDNVRGTNLKDLKKASKKDTGVKGQIVDLLQKEGIAFLDIMKDAVRKDGSSSDDDIKNFSLDFDIFETVFAKTLKSSAVKVICNSRLAEQGYNKIKDELKVKGIDLPESIYISQVRRLQKTEKAKWLKELY